MPNLIEQILLELEYSSDNGIIDFTKVEQVSKLEELLRKNGITNYREIAEKTTFYFMQLKEENEKKGQSQKHPGYFHRGGGYYSKSDSGEITHKSDGGALKPLSAKEKQEKNKELTPAVSKQKTATGTDIDVSDAERAAAAKKSKNKNPQEIKREIDRISIEAGQSRDKFYEKGYHKSESDDDSGAAPGNAGSMLNENGSCDVCEWALENDNDNLVDAVKHLYENLKGGALLEATDKTGIAGQEDKVPSISTKQLKEFRAAGKGKFDNLSDGQLSRLMVAANGGLIKAKNLRQGIKNNKWKLEDCIVNGFFGDAGGKSQQINMVTQSNRIFAPDGTEIPKEEALKLVSAGGGGANPSDTSQFVYNQKTGDLMIKFTSDKDSFDAIVAQSSFQKEGSIKKSQIDELVKNNKLNKEGAEKLKQLIDKKTSQLNAIESELKLVGAEPAKKMLEMPIKDVVKEFKTLSAGSNPDAYYNLVVKKYMSKPFNAKDPNEAVTQFLKFSSMTSEEQEAYAEKTGSKIAKFTSKEAEIIGRLKSRFGLDPLVAEKIDDIRKRSIAVERKMLDEMNKINIPISGGKVGLGDYMDALNFVEKFHMAGAMGDKHGVFAYDGLFEVVCGIGVINNDIITNCMNTNKMDDFIKKFGSTKEEFQLSKENQITGSVRIAYFLNDKGEKIRIGEKRQRSKTGATGRFNTVYKWDKDTIECFKRKNGIQQ